MTRSLIGFQLIFDAADLSNLLIWAIVVPWRETRGAAALSCCCRSSRRSVDCVTAAQPLALQTTGYDLH
jgi:hypothetical protein